MADKDQILTMSDISKTFPGVKALSNVNFRLLKGEVHALMGENGAGKSTLIKVLTGVHDFDNGKILFDGKTIIPESPLDAQKMGISTVYQEVNLCLNLSVSENIFIGRQPMKNGFIDWKEMNKQSEILLEKLNIKIDVTQILSSYSVAIQQMVSIARSLLVSAKILILDEPTSSLDDSEVKQLFSVVNRLKKEGLAILFITHFLDQVYQIADRITVLKNGELVGEYKTQELPKVELVAKMIGKELAKFSKMPKSTENKKKTNNENILLKVNNLWRKSILKPVTFELNKGEVLGFAGLLGSGRTESVRLIFGIDKHQQGDVSVRGKKINLDTPKNAVSSGMAFCPEDRKSEGLLSELTVRENIILALQGKYGLLKFINKKKQDEIANEYIKILNINTPGTGQKVKNLSGGNQQKIILARWLATNPQVLLLDEPTRGIDVGAKAEILKFILSLCSKGIGIVFISSELDEVINCSNRILVLRDGEKISEFSGDEIDENLIMHTIAGGQK